MIDTLLLSAPPTIAFVAVLVALFLAFAWEPPKPPPACCQIWQHSNGQAHGHDCTRKDQTT